MEAYLDKEVQKGNEKAAHIMLKHQGAFSNLGAAKTLISKYFSQALSDKLPVDFMDKCYAVLDQGKMEDIGLDDPIRGRSPDRLC